MFLTHSGAVHACSAATGGVIGTLAHRKSVWWAEGVRGERGNRGSTAAQWARTAEHCRHALLELLSVLGLTVPAGQLVHALLPELGL